MKNRESEENKILQIAKEIEDEILEEFESYTEEEQKDYIKTYQEKRKEGNKE